MSAYTRAKVFNGVGSRRSPAAEVRPRQSVTPAGSRSSSTHPTATTTSSVTTLRSSSSGIP
jgi:hypothetical protein